MVIFARELDVEIVLEARLFSPYNENSVKHSLPAIIASRRCRTFEDALQPDDWLAVLAMLTSWFD
jgi:hypothetical protein